MSAPCHIGGHDCPNSAKHGADSHTSVSHPETGTRYLVKSQFRKRDENDNCGPPCWEEFACVEVGCAKRCCGSKLAQKVKSCPKSRQRGCNNNCQSIEDFSLLKKINSLKPGVSDAARQENPPIKSDAARVALRPICRIPTKERR